MKITITSKDFGAAKALLNRVGEKVDGALEGAFEAGTSHLHMGAQNRVPVKSGNLKRNIKKEVSSSTPGRWSGTVHVDLSGAPYGAEVEFGSSGLPEGVILPKKGKFLKFEIGGKTIFAKAVFQPGKPYMRPAFEQDGPEAVEIIKKMVLETLQ